MSATTMVPPLLFVTTLVTVSFGRTGRLVNVQVVILPDSTATLVTLRLTRSTVPVDVVPSANLHEMPVRLQLVTVSSVTEVFGLLAMSTATAAADPVPLMVRVAVGFVTE